MAENHDVKDIEANLKRMLNLQPKQVGLGDKEKSITDVKQEPDSSKKDRKPGVSKKKKEGKSSDGGGGQADQLTAHHHQSDPAIGGQEMKEENQQQQAVKKKKKKPKKKNNQEKAEQQTAGDKPGLDTGQSKKEKGNKKPGLDTGQSKNEKGNKQGEKQSTDGKQKQEKQEESDDSDDGRPSPAWLMTAMKVKYLDDKLTPAILKELEKEKIFPLKKKSSKFPQAKYFCRICDYHCDNVPVCRQHYNESRHRRRVEIAVQDRMFKNLPKPSKRHLESLNQVLLEMFQQYGLSDQELQQRADIASSVEKFINQSIPGVELRVYGSSLTGFGLKTSNLNMDLVVPKGDNPANLLTRIYRLLSNSDTFKKVKSNFLAKVPSILFESPCGTVHCEISVNSELAFYTSRLLAIYSRVDPRVRQLGVIFRYWAKICQTDDQDKGSLPTYTYDLMTVYYLQQCKPPLLPVLWKDLSETVLKRPKTPNDILTMLTNLDIERQEWVCENDTSLGQLWLDLLLFFGVNYNVSDHVVCIRQERVLLRSEKKWKTRKLAIEDPFSPKRNVARTLFSVRVFDYVYNCLRKGCLYFSLPTNNKNISHISNNKTNHKPSSQNQITGSPDSPKQDSKIVEVPCKSNADKVLKNSDGGSDNLQDNDSCKDAVVNSDKDKKSHLESVLTASGSSSDFSIKENEFVAENKDIQEDITEESDNGAKIKIHSFLSSGETSGDTENITQSPKKDVHEDCSELVDGVKKLNVNSSNLENVKEIETCEKEVFDKQNNLESDSLETDVLVLKTEDSIVTDTVLTKESKTVTDSKCDCRTSHNELSVLNTNSENCDHSDNKEEKGEALSPVGANLEVNSPKKSTNLQRDDTESSEQENILSVYTQEDVVEAVDNVVGNSNDTGNVSDKEDVSILLDEEDSKAGVTDRVDVEDMEDIIDHSFLADDSALVDMFDSTLNESERACDDAETVNDHESSAIIDSEPSSGSESDRELESPESSPVKKKKWERPRSPEDAEYDFVFSVDSLTDGKGPSIFCSICEKEGHLKGNCPEELLPEVKHLGPVSKQHLKLLTSVIRTVPNDFQLSQRELDDREAVRWGLECFIQELFPDAELSLFGSSKNGFGFHYSDLDICVTFRDKNPADLNFVELIEALSKKLKTHKSFYNVFPITTAKVPIVKFIHRPTRLEGDISLYNILAQQNTRLLYCYSCIDQRVVTLGYAIKVFAKVCDIGDASKGSLSSYAYMLLLFHYLQHTKPPVIPVLQELWAGDEKPTFLVDGCNAWFYDDMKNLPKVWPGYRRNNQSIGELWLGLFKYYVEEFNVEEQVVTIRQSELLTKFEKLWNRKCIAIEDPFDLSHNLGAGLTRKMHKYIMSALINARELYGLSVTGPPDGFNSLADYFFDRDMLTEGEVPNDRLCRVCSKIGHIAKECPRVLARKEREAEERKRKEEQRRAQEMRDKGGTGGNRGNNQNKPKQQAKSRPGTGRSLSDPVDSSPRRPHGRGQIFVNRQFSAGADLQSYDNAQGFKQSPRQHGPSSPQPIPSQMYNRDRRPQNNSPRSYPQTNQPQSPRGFNPPVQGFSPGGFGNQQYGNPFQWANQNDNSGRRNYHPPIQNFANLSHFGTNQNQNNIQPLLSLPTQIPGNQQFNGSRGYTSSPNQNLGYQSRKQQAKNFSANEDKDLNTSANRKQASNRSQHKQQKQQQQQQQQQGTGSMRQVTMGSDTNRLAGMGVTVNNEYYHDNKGMK